MKKLFLITLLLMACKNPANAGTPAIAKVYKLTGWAEHITVYRVRMRDTGDVCYVLKGAEGRGGIHCKYTEALNGEACSNP